MQEIMTFIQQVGVPAAIAILVILKVDKSIGKVNENLADLREQVAKQTLVLINLLKKQVDCTDIEALIAEAESKEKTAA